MRIEKILVPIDFSPTARLALRHAMALARKCRARLTLLHVVESPTALTIAFPEEAVQIEREHVEQARRMLAALVEPEQGKDVSFKTTVKSGDVLDEIVSTIRDE